MLKNDIAVMQPWKKSKKNPKNLENSKGKVISLLIKSIIDDQWR